MENGADSAIKSGAKKYLIRAFVAPILMCALYFLAAGSLMNYRGWIYFTIFLALSVITNGYLYSKKPELLYHRSRMKKDAKGWDKWLMPISMFTGFHFQCLIMGIDFRYGWSKISEIFIPIGLLFFICSFAITTWAMLVNSHFETNVRIQKDRAHKVISDGPYKYVRHPGYIAFILGTFGAPLVVGSLAGIVMALLASLFIIYRTFLEDRTLQSELEGYQLYAKDVRYKLFPKVW